MKMLLLSFLWFNLSYAKDSGKETRVYGGYLLEAQKSCDDSKQYKTCWPDTLPATIVDSKKSAITTIPNVHYRHYHPFEVHGREIFWISRVGDTSTKDWSDQLWVKELPSNKEEKLLEHKGVDFRASPEGKMVIFTEGDTVSVLDRKSNSTKVLSHSKDAGRDDGFTLLTWSTDGSKFWFGAGVVESWSKLAVLKAGKVMWFPLAGGSSDEALEPDQGWLVTSDTPFNYDVESEEEFKKSKTMTKLEVVDVFTGKKAVLAEAEANHYKPFWTSEGLLQYSIANKTFKVSKSQIAGKLR